MGQVGQVGDKQRTCDSTCCLTIGSMVSYRPDVILEEEERVSCRKEPGWWFEGARLLHKSLRHHLGKAGTRVSMRAWEGGSIASGFPRSRPSCASTSVGERAWLLLSDNED